MDNQFFEKLNSINWFSNCGNEFVIEDFPIKIHFVSSVDEMIKSMSADNWENATLEAQNRLTMFLHERENRKYNEYWNKITVSNKEKLGLVEGIAKGYADKYGLGKIFIDFTLWNVLGASME